MTAKEYTEEDARAIAARLSDSEKELLQGVQLGKDPYLSASSYDALTGAKYTDVPALVTSIGGKRRQLTNIGGMVLAVVNREQALKAAPKLVNQPYELLARPGEPARRTVFAKQAPPAQAPPPKRRAPPAPLPEVRDVLRRPGYPEPEELEILGMFAEQVNPGAWAIPEGTSAADVEFLRTAGPTVLRLIEAVRTAESTLRATLVRAEGTQRILADRAERAEQRVRELEGWAGVVSSSAAAITTDSTRVTSL